MGDIQMTDADYLKLQKEWKVKREIASSPLGKALK
jgi:hypothetical protein